MVNHRLCGLLETYHEHTQDTVKRIKKAKAMPTEAQAVLLMRWGQINTMVENAIQRLE